MTTLRADKRERARRHQELEVAKGPTRAGPSVEPYLRAATPDAAVDHVAAGIRSGTMTLGDVDRVSAWAGHAVHGHNTRLGSTVAGAFGMPLLRKPRDPVEVDPEDAGAVAGLVAGLGSGQPLSLPMRRALERRFAELGLPVDLDPVRVHVGDDAAALCEALHARAVTTGSHVAFGPGEFRPASPEGFRLLAHELTHVAQQETRTVGAGRRACRVTARSRSGGRRACGGRRMVLHRESGRDGCGGAHRWCAGIRGRAATART